MLFTTPGQFLVLALVLVIGWLFGLASHPGGRKWKDRYYAERDAHAATRSQHESRINELERQHAESERQRLDAERERDRHRDEAAAAAAAAPVAASAARPAHEDRDAARDDRTSSRRGWFDWARRDDLTRINGVDADSEARMRDDGVRSYADLAKLDADGEARLEDRLGLPSGRIAHDRWREQAALLADGNEDEWRRRYG